MRKASNILSRKVIDYWFEGLKKGQAAPAELTQKWFNGGKEVDEYISKHFQKEVDEIHQGEHDELTQSAEGILSLIIALDQFPRNMYRNSSKMFSYDSHALKLAKEAIENRFDQELIPVQRGFLYLPFEHSEGFIDQETSVALYEKLVDALSPNDAEYGMAKAWLQFAIDHRDIIQRFGRFPHRNQIVDRTDTPEEREYLASLGGSVYGVDVKK